MGDLSKTLGISLKNSVLSSALKIPSFDKNKQTSYIVTHVGNLTIISNDDVHHL